MRIIILGAGQVGGTLAYNLVHEDNDITLVDLDDARIRELQLKLDIRTIQGCASHPQVLIEAGIEQADMLIAVTTSDEVNMIACQIAYSLFRTPTKIARIRSDNYYNYPHLFTNDHIPVDVIISPEQLVTAHVMNLIEHPGAAQVLDFAQNKVLLATINLHENTKLSGQPLDSFYTKINPSEAKVIALFRKNVAIDVSKPCIVQEDDSLLIIANAKTLQQTLSILGYNTHPLKRIMIAGGGRIGAKLAKQLESNYRVKVIESDHEKANILAQSLNKATILHGDAGDKELLLNENIEFTDVFCAVTNDDEVNIMACLQAKKLGARQTICLVNRSAYAELIADSNIDHAISPQQITIGSILTKLRRGNMIKVCRLKDENREAIELVVRGDSTTSHVIGQRLDKVKLPKSCLWGCVVRGNKILMPHDDLVLKSNDHVILLLLNKRYIRDVESLFQVTLAFTQ